MDQEKSQQTNESFPPSSTEGLDVQVRIENLRKMLASVARLNEILDEGDRQRNGKTE